MARTNIKHISHEKTHEGAPSKARQSSIQELRRTVMACMLFEGTFYEDGQSIADRIKSLIKNCSFEEVALLAIEAKTKMNLRHVPLFLTRELLRNYNGKKVGDLISLVIKRPDELGELLAMYWSEGKRPLTSQLKIGLARALKSFNEYELAKWNKDGAVKLRDVLFLCHARPMDDKQEKLFKKIANNELVTPDTWEVALSGGADKKEVFERLLKEKKLGAMALLRNLRGMTEANVDSNLIREAIVNMNTEKILPFRFISAARYAPQFEDVLESAMFRCAKEFPKLKGTTVLLIDHSGSMKVGISDKSNITRFDAACGVAMLLREMTEQVNIFTFSTECKEIPPRKGFALRDVADTSMHNNATYLGKAIDHIHKNISKYDRLIVITDEQSADAIQQPKGLGYIVNVASYKNGIGYGPWNTINGWSESIINYIYTKELENA